LGRNIEQKHENASVAGKIDAQFFFHIY
jgi:hypothetical protein